MDNFVVPSPLQPQEYEVIRRMVYEQTGINLTPHKKIMVQSRLMKRLKQLGCRDFQDYLKQTKKDANEKAMMFNLITTNVTHFFREQHHFDFLCQYLPQYLSQHKNKKLVKLWSAGCSTGQEPYSLAITLADFFRKQPGDFQILASDINTEVLRKAQQGIYLSEEVADIDYQLLKAHFKLGQGANRGLFKVKDQLQKKICFKQINLIDHHRNLTEEERFDFIFCRNVFIYFDQETKKGVLRRFYNQLNPGGCLFLGHSESLNPIDPTNGTWKSLAHTVYLKQ